MLGRGCVYANSAQVDFYINETFKSIFGTKLQVTTMSRLKILPRFRIANVDFFGLSRRFPAGCGATNC